MTAQAEQKGFFPRMVEEIADYVKNKLPEIDRVNAKKAQQLHNIRALMSSDYWPSFEEALLEMRQDAQVVASTISPVGDGVLDLVGAQREIKVLNTILQLGED